MENKHSKYEQWKKSASEEIEKADAQRIPTGQDMKRIHMANKSCMNEHADGAAGHHGVQHAAPEGVLAPAFHVQSTTIKTTNLAC